MSDSDERAARRAAQLRTNLHRRKAQARAGAGAGAAVPAPAPAPRPADSADRQPDGDDTAGGGMGDGRPERA